MKTNVNYNSYLASHNRMPRGKAMWAFCPADRYKDANYLDHVVWSKPMCSFSDALKDALKLFRGRGVSEIVVCP